MDKSKVQDEKMAPRGAKLKKYMTEKNTMRELLPPHITWAHFKAVVFGALKKNPKLLECRYDTIEKSIMDAATAGLEVNSVLAEASLVPFGNECKLMIEWRGLAKMAWASGFINRVDHGQIRANDKYKYVDGINQVFEVERDLTKTEEERGEPIAYYAIAELTGGGYSVVVMTVDEITKHGQRYSKSFNKSGSAWKDYFEGQAIKTCYRVLYDKKIPKSTFDDKVREVMAKQFSFEHEVAEYSIVPEAEEADFEDTTESGVEKGPNGTEQSTDTATEEPGHIGVESLDDTAKAQDTTVKDENDVVENFFQVTNKLCVEISKLSGNPYESMMTIAGTQENKLITNPEIQNQVVTALQEMLVTLKREEPEMPIVSDYLSKVNDIIEKIEHNDGEWKSTLKAFTGKEELDDEISSPSKQNVLNRLQSELDDLIESKGQ